MKIGFNKEFETVIQNRVVKIRKKHLTRKLKFCSTKGNLSNLITCLDKNIDLSKNSLWWRGQCFLFDETQSYNENNYCENKETLPESFARGREIKNRVTFC